MNLTFQIIAPKKTWLDLISRKNLLLYLILPLFPIDLIILPLVPAEFSYIFLYLTVALAIAFISLFYLPDIFFTFVTNYKTIGTLKLFDDRIVTTIQDVENIFICEESKLVFLYDHKRGSYFRKGENKRNGFNQLIINEQPIHFLVRNDEELNQLKKLFTIWYNNEYQFDEFTNGKDRHRMVLMDQNFDWKAFEIIKQKRMH